MEKKHTAEEILELFCEVAPYLNSIVPQDMSVSVIKGDRYVSCVQPEHYSLPIKVGDPVTGKTAERCINNGMRVIRAVGSEMALGGIPYLVCGMPIIEDGKVIGCVLTTQMISNQEKVNNIAHSFANINNTDWKQYNRAFAHIAESYNHSAEEKRACIAHKCFGRIPIPAKKSQNTA